MPKFIAERIIGVSIPLENELVLISYEGIHFLNLLNPDVVMIDKSLPEGGELFDRERSILSYRDQTYQILGLFGGNPILKNLKEESLLIDTSKQILSVNDAKGIKNFEFQYEYISGDWCSGTFSDYGRYILLCLPYELYAFKRVNKT